MKYFENLIDKQIALNTGRNIYHFDSGFFIGEELFNSTPIVNELSKANQDLLIDYVTENSIKEFCRVNQYYSFNTVSIIELRNIYSNLLRTLKKSSFTLEELSEQHQNNLADWLYKYNSFAKSIYGDDSSLIEPTPCSEYSSDLQCAILKLDFTNLREPILDIGCGIKGILVKALMNKGLKVYGIDRFTNTNNNFLKADWLEYRYGTKKWGTVISNLGISNHFKNHNLREDGSYIKYAKTFMNILYSLKIGGKFHYAPDLPFIEKYIDNNQFYIEKYELNKYDFKITIITRLN